MKDNLKISVIIPVYGVAEYLSVCVDSVIHQTYENLEIILVDDGSPDHSGQICDDYAVKDDRIYVIHKTNGGLSDARNSGISCATGDYVMFMDGDDFWAENGAVQEIVERLSTTKADVLTFSFCKFFEDSQKISPYFPNVISMPLSLRRKKDQLAYLTSNHLYISSACVKVVRRELLSPDMAFEKGVIAEDIEWSAKLLTKANSIDYVHADFYRYRQRTSSISHSVTDKACADTVKHILACMELMRKSGEDEREALAYYTAYQFGTFFAIQARADNSQQEQLNVLKEYCGILSHHHKNSKLRVLHILCTILGYKNTCGLIRFAIQAKTAKESK